MTAYRVIVPTESYSVIEFQQDDLPGIGAINTALRDFDSKPVFGWHLSLMLQLDDLIENGMPSRAERDIVDRFWRHARCSHQRQGRCQTKRTLSRTHHLECHP